MNRIIVTTVSAVIAAHAVVVDLRLTALRVPVGQTLLSGLLNLFLAHFVAFLI
jgi:hypothetical protein